MLICFLQRNMILLLTLQLNQLQKLDKIKNYKGKMYRDSNRSEQAENRQSCVITFRKK